MLTSRGKFQRLTSHYHFQKPEADRSAIVVDRLNREMPASLKFLDTALAGRVHLGGDRFTVADLNVACGLRNAAKLKVDLAPFANVSRWLGACLGREAQLKVAAMPHS